MIQNDRVPLVSYVFLGLITAFVLLPLGWAISTSLKELPEAIAYPPRWFPLQPTLENFKFVLTSPKLHTYFVNSFAVIAMTIGLTFAIAVPAAYAAERGRFAGRDAMMKTLWATNMLSGVAIVLPLYLVSVKIGLYDTRFGLVLVYAAAVLPTVVWLLRGFIARVPAELEQAAQIDGCSPFSAFILITLPLLRAGLVAASIFIFVTIWNDFLIAYSLVLSDERRTVQIGIYFFVTDTGVQWGRMMAAVLVSCVPVLLLYGFLQKSFVQGLGGGAVNE